jgi:hypothetical protein
MKQAYRYWIIPKNGNPPFIILAAEDDQNARDTAVAWYGMAPDSFYVSRAE